MPVPHAELEARAMELARQLANNSMAATGLAKPMMRHGAKLSAYERLEDEALATTFGTQAEDRKEGCGPSTRGGEARPVM
ncbi:MAG TPA: hypothetical protein VNP04_02445 [Alphaproteobacteria bacterium]|nr:hypothetical protein [Alphaproteobacteria bacterium]